MDAHKNADFSGYATKAGIKCSDGRTIMPDAFKHMDGQTVPLVWQHGHNSPENVLGHAVLEARKDGVYAHGYFNETPQGKTASALVSHKDIENLSIYANQLVERSKQVFHGFIREVSLVLSGANPGAKIENVAIQHGDGEIENLDDEVIIYTGESFEHADLADDVDDVDDEDEDDTNDEGNDISHADDDDEIVADVFEALNDKQKKVVYYMIGAALEEAAAEHSDNSDAITHQEGSKDMNVFDQHGKDSGDGSSTQTLSHDAVAGIVQQAVQHGSMKAAVEEYALQHGITNIDVLFPEAKALPGTPEWDSRQMEWVKGVLNSTRKTPFSKIKTLSADITMDEARAKGYIKGEMKKEEFFSVSRRTTGPTTIYKKQKLDRDDMLDITDFDVVAWLKAEMRLMLDEEIARAILIGDGRAVDDEDKIKDPAGAADGTGVRSILHDHDMYVTTVNVNVGDEDSSYEEVVEAVMRARRFYKGSGDPTFYTTTPTVVEMMLAKDGFGRRLWGTMDELKKALRVGDIVEVEAMESEDDLLGIVVNLRDYNVGADKGGQVSMFDDFDIDYNQHKYLLETRISGALAKLKSALVIKKTAASSALVIPAEPDFDGEDVVITDQTGVEYYDASDDTELTNSGGPYTLAEDESLTVYAVPTDGYHFATDREDQWTFTNVVEAN